MHPDDIVGALQQQPTQVGARTPPIVLHAAHARDLPHVLEDAAGGDCELLTRRALGTERVGEVDLLGEENCSVLVSVC